MTTTLGEAVETARQHLPIQREVMRTPVGYVIHEGSGGDTYYVYNNEVQSPGGFMPPGKREGYPVATVDLAGVVHPIPNTTGRR